MTQLNNVNFELLLKAHNGDYARAETAWNYICKLGKYGDVSPGYEGGLDVKGLRISLDEIKNGVRFQRYDPAKQKPMAVPETVTADDLKRIEDMAAGDRPEAVVR